LIVAADSEKMLFSDSLARQAAQRIFSIFRLDPSDTEFLESVSDIGPIAARRLKRLMFGIVKMDLDLGIEWISRGTIFRGIQLKPKQACAARFGPERNDDKPTRRVLNRRQG
jgi:hypothetical protein